MRIDFLGLPGTGKSAIYEQLGRIKRSKRRYLLQDEAKLDYICNTKPLSESNNARIIKLLFSLKINKMGVILRDRYLYLAKRNAFYTQHEVIEQFLNHTLKGVAEANFNIFSKYNGINYLHDCIEDVLLLGNNKNNLPVIFDESLSLKILGLVPYSLGHFEEFTRTYFKLMPLPNIVLYTHCSLETNLKRLKNRNRVNFGHRNLTDEQLKRTVEIQESILKIGLEVLEKQNVYILHLNTENSFIENARAVSDKIHDILELTKNEY
jgi:hypothetical protein